MYCIIVFIFFLTVRNSILEMEKISEHIKNVIIIINCLKYIFVKCLYFGENHVFVVNEIPGNQNYWSFNNGCRSFKDFVRYY